MLFFVNDYGEGAHEALLARLMETNREHLPGYGSDTYTAQAQKKILAAAGCPHGTVWFLTGGTQTNRVVISACLRDWEGVLACRTGHIAVHEAGAIENSGHKVITLPAHEGKMDAEELGAWLAAFYADPNHDHMVFPGMVYLSYPTEYGTLYTKEELTAIAAVARRYRIPLYIDGARLGYGLASPACDLTLPELASLCQVFYIGGTKVGALCGEAVVFPHGSPAHFLTRIKQNGALLAKGRLLGVQFDALFTDDLYLTISRHAIAMAMKLKEVFRSRGYPLFIDSPTNQQFVILTQEEAMDIAQWAQFELWEPLGEDRVVVRFAVSWATEETDIDELAARLPERTHTQHTQEE